MNYDNPAARLLSILQKGKEQPTSSKCRAVWEELLEVEGDTPLLMARLGKVMELPQQIISMLKEVVPEQGNTWSHWESKINAAFMVQNMHAQWDTFINNIDGHTFTYLNMSSALLQATANTKLIADAELKAVRITLQETLAEVLESEMPVEVKKYLARNLRRIIASIDEYKLTGALPLLEAIETTFGHAYIDKQYKTFLTDTELGKRLLDTLASMANVVTVAVGLPQLTQAIALLAS